MKSIINLARRALGKTRSGSTRNKAKLCVTLLEDRAVPANVNVTVFYDGNGDGEQDGGENYAEGVGVMLSGFDGSSQAGTTNAEGFYSFPDVSPGSYTVNVTNSPAGYTVQLANGSVNPFSVGADDVGVGFGLEGGSGGGSGSSSGSISPTVSYDVPWDSYNTDEDTQTLPASNFSLTLAGQTFTEGTPNVVFTVSPQVQFASDTVTGIVFTIDTSAVADYPYDSITGTIANGMNTASAVLRGTTTSVSGSILAAPPEGTFYLNQGALRTKDDYFIATKLHVKVEAGADVTPYTYDIDIASGATVGDITSQVVNSMQTAGWKVSKLDSGKGLQIFGYMKDGALVPITKAGIYADGANDNKQPKLVKVGITALVYSNGTWSDAP